MSRRKLGDGWTEEAPEEEKEPDEPGVQVYTPGSIPSEKKNKSVFGYLVILFIVAFLMLVLAFFMQERNSSAQIGALQDSLASAQSMDELVNENKALREENETLKGTAGELERAQAELERVKEELELAKKNWNPSQQEYDILSHMLSQRSILVLLEELMRLERYEDAADLCRVINTKEPDLFNVDDPHHDSSIRVETIDIRIYVAKLYTELELELIEKGYLTAEDAGLTILGTTTN